jgi:uncharacterized protein (TIGR00106 family)
MDDKRPVTVAVQVLPLTEDAYSVVDRAIEVIALSGVEYEVGPMETTMEGDLDELLEVAKAAHRSCFQAGAERVVTVIKISDDVSGSTIADKTERYRS